ncbi:hypothetical protein C8J57DRAFT_1502577 [Mycena rebaudengoi]|nr:hypothetical protein C8J57DRAFT_1502577 [Mycena rebaudengoi]
MGIAAALFGLVIVVYSVLTLLPLTLRPYLTWRPPTSATSTHAPSSNHSDTMVEAMVHRATQVSEQRAIRDQRALIWTVKSLTDEIELEPFVESIPDALWGPNGRRWIYDHYILSIANDPEACLVTRIEDLLRSGNSDLLSAELKERRQLTCLKALWAIASITDRTKRTRFLFDMSAVHRLTGSSVSDAVHYHALSVYTLIQWHSSCALNDTLRVHEEDFQMDHVPDAIDQMILLLADSNKRWIGIEIPR